MSSRDSLRAALARAVEQDFGSQFCNMHKLCINSSGAAVGESHVSCLNELYEPVLEQGVVEDLSIPYIYLAASFFCIDHVFDGDEHESIEVLAPSLLISAAIGRLLRLVKSDLVIEKVVGLHNRFLSAMLLEKESLARFDIVAGDRDHMVDRSYLFIFALEMLALVKSINLSSDDVEDIREFLYLMQRGDDIGDWREDYKAAKYTTFLKSAFAKMGATNPSEAELERFIYLSGIYEDECRAISTQMRVVAAGVVARLGFRGDALVAFIERQVERIEFVRGNFVRVKSGMAPVALPSLS